MFALDFHGQRLCPRESFAVFEARGLSWTWHNTEPNFPFFNGRGNPLEEIARALHWCRENGFQTGAAVGFFAYEAARAWEPKAFSQTLKPNSPLPDIRLVFCRELEKTASPVPETAPVLGEIPPCESARRFYENGVEKIREFIAAGDIYQANLTYRFDWPLHFSPAELYRRVRALSPAPYSALLEWDDFSLVSNSPEGFLQLKNGILTARPIKGTIRRGATAEEDAQLKNQLLASAKDRAENVMIVDLLRNDLGRVCEYGSVAVPQLCDLESWATLHHLVSTVTGRLRENASAVEAFGAAFPCGSITGAPKIRAMQILDELEPVARGANMGAIGYFGFNGEMDWSVAIRTATCANNRLYFHAGGGIVIDSEPETEYQEMRLKARAMWSATGTRL